MLRILLLGFAGLPGFIALPLMAQDGNPPQAYSLTAYVQNPASPFLQVHIDRDGPKELVTRHAFGTDGGLTKFTFYDFGANKVYIWQYGQVPRGCSATEYRPAEKMVDATALDDPIDGPTARMLDIPKESLKLVGSETLVPDRTRTIGYLHLSWTGDLNGIATNVMEGPLPSGGTARIWLADKTNIAAKVEITEQNSEARTLLEVVQLSFARPPASAFVLPAGCDAVGTGGSRNPDNTIIGTIAGTWDWVSGQTLHVNGDGTFEVYWGGPKVNEGTWMSLGARQYRLTHRGGGYVDTVTLSRDGNSLDGTNNSGLSLHGSRKR